MSQSQPHHRVLFTRGLSSVHDALSAIRQDSRSNEFTLLASYNTALTPLQHVADILLPEPAGRGEEWLAWLSATVHKQRVDLLWPQSWTKTLLSNPSFVSDLNIPVLLPCSNPETYQVFRDKAECHQVLVSRLPGLALPWQVAATGAVEVGAAIGACRELGMVPCVKPLEGIFGLGFRRIDSDSRALRRILDNDTFSIAEDDLLRALSADVKPPPLLVMEYLAGEERSLDILAWHGDIVTCVVRRKATEYKGRCQAIEADRPSEEIAETLVREFNLHGVINIQTRERVSHNGTRQACFLEANLRMSGGIGRSRAAGINLPLWAVRLALGTASVRDVPTSSTACRVATYEIAVRVDEVQQNA